MGPARHPPGFLPSLLPPPPLCPTTALRFLPCNKSSCCCSSRSLGRRLTEVQANLCLAVSLIGAGLYGEAKRRQGNTPPPQVGSGRDDGKQREHNGTGEHKDPESQLHPDRHNSK
mmetsp:Transcript_48683/g.152829  ORF Transcript_48683/g.152829 Transcript_48683/m.152829 type:complete len:115 (-) Transcript_48683:42-386(-)